MRTLRAILTGLSLVAAATAALAARPLTPAEVVVVDNSASADSRAVAAAYVRCRAIPAGNLIEIPLAPGEEVSRADYTKLIRDPIVRAMADRHLTGVRCLCLVYGLPMRIGPDGNEPQVRDVYRGYIKESRARLTQMAGSPAFAQAPGRQGPPAAALDDLLTDVTDAVVRRLPALAAVSGPEQRLAAYRQWLAWYRDLYGLRGLVDLLGRQRIEGAPDLGDLRKQLQAAEEVLRHTLEAGPSESAARQKLAMQELAGGMWAAVAFARAELDALKPTQTDASVDSELAMLAWQHYDLRGPLPNPLNWRTADANQAAFTLMTSRIDGPTRADAMRMIKVSLSTEKEGLRGRFYIDAGGPHKGYDTHLRQLYENIKRDTKLSAVFEDTRALFAPRSCPDAALYVGWYSPGRYVPSMEWIPGAVGWHIAGCEARGLHDPESDEWCPQMIRAGVAATIGGLGEPTLGAFPVPEDFFGLLLTGKHTVAECYWRTVGHVSWRMVLLADPLYDPFAANPQIDPKNLPKGLEP